MPPWVAYYFGSLKFDDMPNASDNNGQGIQAFVAVLPATGWFSILYKLSS